MSVDLYKILGVQKNASQAEIKSAYRRLAMRYHPDQNPGDQEVEERFKEVAQAYAVLGDPQKRRTYDRVDARGAGGLSGAPAFDSFAEIFDVLNSVFSRGIGAASRVANVNRGADISVELSITLEEAMQGVRRDVTVPRPRECLRCGGSGAEPGTSLRSCPVCEGQGQVRTQQGFFSLMRRCKNCDGRGQVAEKACRRCKGSAEIEGTELLPVDVPAGVRSGQTLRWAKKGAPGRAGAPAGDLLVTVRVAEHPVFKREGQDIHMSFPISFTQASLGARVEVPTLERKVVMKVPPGTQTGRVLRLRGMGLPAVGEGARGDHYVRLEVKTPEQVKRRQEELREDIEKGSGGGSRGRGIWRRVRDFFD